MLRRLGHLVEDQRGFAQLARGGGLHGDGYGYARQRQGDQRHRQPRHRPVGVPGERNADHQQHDARNAGQPEPGHEYLHNQQRHPRKQADDQGQIRQDHIQHVFHRHPFLSRRFSWPYCSMIFPRRKGALLQNRFWTFQMSLGRVFPGETVPLFQVL